MTTLSIAYLKIKSVLSGLSTRRCALEHSNNYCGFTKDGGYSVNNFGNPCCGTRCLVACNVDISLEMVLYNVCSSIQ